MLAESGSPTAHLRFNVLMTAPVCLRASALKPPMKQSAVSDGLVNEDRIAQSITVDAETMNSALPPGSNGPPVTVSCAPMDSRCTTFGSMRHSPPVTLPTLAETLVPAPTSRYCSRPLSVDIAYQLLSSRRGLRWRRQAHTRMSRTPRTTALHAGRQTRHNAT